MNSSSEEEDLSVASPPCQYIQPMYIEQRFYLVTIFGSFIAVISMVENVFLFIMLVTRQHHRNSYALYLLLLAFCDVFVSGAYIPLMSVNNVLDYMQSVTLLRAWFTYMVPMITISHIALTTSSFLILAASVERYVLTEWPNSKFLDRHRRQIAALAVFLGIFTKITVALELDVKYESQCQDTMVEYSLSLSALAQNPLYYGIWRLWFRNIFTILLPFFLLAALNVRIVLILQRSGGEFLGEQKLSDAQRKARVRAATRTLVMVVFTYLLSNVVNVVVTIWEYVDIDSLNGTFLTFYTFSVDVVSLLSIVAAALRLPIYVSCQKQLRSEFAIAIKNLCRKKKLQSCPTSIVEDHQKMLNGGGMVKCDKLVEENDDNTNIDDMSTPHYSELILRIGTALMKNNNMGEESHPSLNNYIDECNNIEYNNEIDVLL